MYTALHFSAELKKDTPEMVVDVLNKMVNGKLPFEDPKELPDHEFFKCDRWCFLFTMDSYYFSADTHCSFRFDEIAGAWFLTVTSNIKNYDGEIQKFIDWIMPYVAESTNDFLGYYRYEENREPTLIYKKLTPKGE